jgi:hypothetical protein
VGGVEGGCCWRVPCWYGFWSWVVVVRLRIVRVVVNCVALGRRARRVVRARDSIVGL